MKKLITLLVIMLVAYQFSQAQSSTPAIGNSYTTNVVTDVFPYQSGRKPKIDSTIHFKLNVNTKFQIVDVKDSADAIKGYIITPWKFKGKAKYHKVKIEKSEFYKTIYPNYTDLVKVKLFKDSIKKLKDTVTALNARRKTDTLDVIQSKKAVADTLAIVENKSQLLFASLAYVDSGKIVPVKKTDSKTHSKLVDFNVQRSAAKKQLNNSNDPPEIIKKQLIATAATLSFTDQGVNKNRASYQLANANLIAAKQKAKTDSLKFANTKARYSDAVEQIKSLFRDNGDETSPSNKFDKDTYRITKKQINDVLDTPANPGSQAAKLDSLAFLESWANHWTFYLPASAFSQNKVEFIYTKSNTFTWGFLSLPIKMRFGNSKGPFDFEQNLQFGITAGDKHQFAKTADESINYLAGVSVVNVPLKDSTSTTAVSLSIGSMFQYGKFQIGLFGGVDLAGSKAAQFNYQGKPWIGVAIGVSLFGEGQTSATVPTQDSN